MLKRFLDISMALAALLLLSPLFALTAIAIRLGICGPSIVSVRRIGRAGQPFDMYKFNTVAKASHAGAWNLRMARLLRHSHLDELPQLVNVLKGDMSLVGPRPFLPEIVDARLPIWRQVLSVRPGISGLTQLTFVFDECDLEENKTTWPDYTSRILRTKLALDCHYVEYHSLRLDLAILSRTLLVVVGGGKTASMFSLLEIGKQANRPGHPIL